MPAVAAGNESVISPAVVQQYRLLPGFEGLADRFPQRCGDRTGLPPSRCSRRSTVSTEGITAGPYRSDSLYSE